MIAKDTVDLFSVPLILFSKEVRGFYLRKFWDLVVKLACTLRSKI